MAAEEEKEKSFKVQDRRRFSAEGELKPEFTGPDDTPERESAAQPSAGATIGAASATSRQAQAQPGGGQDSGYAGAGAGEINFSTFVVGLSTQALLSLGEIPDPHSGQLARDLPAAQQLIDIIGMLQEKTRGNLDREESAMIEAILYELRMKYVELARQTSG